MSNTNEVDNFYCFVILFKNIMLPIIEAFSKSF